MFSTLIEVLGLGCFVAAAAVLGGLAPALLVAGLCLLFVGASVDDAAIGRNLRLIGSLPLRGALGIRNAYRARTSFESLIAE